MLQVCFKYASSMLQVFLVCFKYAYSKLQVGFKCLGRFGEVKWSLEWVGEVGGTGVRLGKVDWVRLLRLG